MIKQYLIKFVLLALMLVLFSSPTSASAAFKFPAPIFVLVDSKPNAPPEEQQQDIWRVDGLTTPANQITHWGYMERPILSPDGKWIAFRSPAKIAVDKIKNGYRSWVRGLMPHAIWIQAVNGSSATIIADQPPFAVYASGTGIDADINYYSEPVWSPDSKQVGWVVMSPHEYDLSLLSQAWYTLDFVVYDLARKTRQSVITPIEVVKSYEGPHEAPRVIWGKSFIAIERETPYGQTEVKFDLGLYATGKMALTGHVERKIEVLDELGLIKNESNKELIFVLPNLQLFDPQTGQPVTLEGRPAVRSTAKTAKFLWAFDWEAENWTQVDAARKSITTTIPKSAIEYSGISPSPDGKGIAYRENGQLRLIYDGQTYSIELLGSVRAVTWGASEWIVVP